MKKYLAIILLGLSSLVSAQTVQTTPNLITSGSSHTWTGVNTGTLPSNYMPGGPTPLYDPSANSITFSYGSPRTVAQTIAINNALSGSGVQVNGYNYSYDVRNMNGDNRQGGTDTFSITTRMTSNTGATLLTATENYNTKFEWTTFSNTKTANSPYQLNQLGSLQFSITGADNGYWAGYFGPQVRNAAMSLNYTVDPCVTNPAYSPSCPNYNTVSFSNNLLPGTTGPQAYAINQALAFAGAGATIHGFDYGYSYNVDGRNCAIWNLFGVCLSGWNYSDAGVTTTITNSAGVVGYTDTTNHSGGNNGVSGNYSRSLRLSNSVPMSTLGTFSMTPYVNGGGSISNMYSNAVYTADPCNANPLYSTTCSGYAAAYMDQQCTANPLYNSACPGYAQAMFTQQCNANQLSNPSCPGYAAAYLSQQCSINPLYSTACSGYSAAQTDCSISPLSHSYCTGYSTAQTQCSSNPLYGSYCPGYTTASLQCSANPLSHSYCPTYTSASNSCSANALTYSFCPGYTTAQTQCTSNPLSNSMCSNYTTASTQCSINPLYASYCPGYSTAQTTCSSDPLSNNLCTGYTTASTECSNNQLSHSYCPSYTSTMNTCSVNPLSNSLCPGYSAATSSCSTNPLYANYCSGYQTALDQCSINPLSNTMCPSYQASTSSCSANPLYANYCPGYQFAYDCQQDGLYSKQCPNYSTAYAKKMVLEQQGMASTVATAGVVAATAPSTTTATTTVSTDGTVSTSTSTTGNSTVDKAITSTTTTANSAAAPAAPVQLVAAPPPVASPVAAKNENNEKKPEPVAADKPAGGPTQTAQGGSDNGGNKPQPTAREVLAERRAEAAKKDAIAKGANLANEMGKAADMEAQKAVQNVVIAAMGFTPGFDVYNNARIPDVNRFYKPYQVYGGQVNVDNRNVSRRLMGGSDKLHQDMVDSQYNREN